MYMCVYVLLYIYIHTCIAWLCSICISLPYNENSIYTYMVIYIYKPCTIRRRPQRKQYVVTTSLAICASVSPNCCKARTHAKVFFTVFSAVAAPLRPLASAEGAHWTLAEGVHI